MKEEKIVLIRTKFQQMNEEIADLEQELQEARAEYHHPLTTRTAHRWIERAINAIVADIVTLQDAQQALELYEEENQVVVSSKAHQDKFGNWK